MLNKKDEADIYVCGGTHKDKMVHYLRKLELEENLLAEDFLKAGFTNYNEPVLYYCRMIQESDNYPVSFVIMVNKEDLTMKEFDLLDENFLQPHPCGKREFREIQKIIEHLQDVGIFKENNDE